MVKVDPDAVLRPAKRARRERLAAVLARGAVAHQHASQAPRRIVATVPQLDGGDYVSFGHRPELTRP